MPYPARRPQGRAELDVSMADNPMGNPNDKDELLVRFHRVEGLEAVRNRSARVHVSRYALGAMLRAFPFPEELRPAAGQLSAWLKKERSRS